MTDDKIRFVLDLYATVLVGEIAATKEEPVREMFRHMQTMIPKMRTMMQQSEAARAGFYVERQAEIAGREKLMRWLGFIQGAFWCTGVYTIDQLRAHNKPADEAFRER